MHTKETKILIDIEARKKGFDHTSTGSPSPLISILFMRHNILVEVIKNIKNSANVRLRVGGI